MSNHDPKQIQCYVQTSLFGTLRENLQKILDRIFDFLQDLQDQIDAITPGGGYDVGNSPDVLPDPPDPVDDEFEGASLDTAGTRFSGANAWSWYQQGSTTFTQSQGSSVMTGDSGDTNDELRYISQAAPTAPWTLRAKMAWGGPNEPENQGARGIVIHNTGNGRYSIIGPGFINAAKIDVTEGIEGTGVPISRGEIISTRADICHFKYVELENDGTDLYFRYSGTGIDGSFIELFSRSIAGFMGAVTHIGIGFSGESSFKYASLVTSWFRRIS